MQFLIEYDKSTQYGGNERCWKELDKSIHVIVKYNATATYLMDMITFYESMSRYDENYHIFFRNRSFRVLVQGECEALVYYFKVK